MNKAEKELIQEYRKILFQLYRTTKNLNKDGSGYLLEAYKKFNEMFPEHKYNNK